MNAEELTEFPHGKLKMWLAPRPVLQPERTRNKRLSVKNGGLFEPGFPFRNLPL